MRASSVPWVASLAGLLAAAVTCAPGPPPKTARTVSAVVLVNRCAPLGSQNAKLAQKAMDQLVEGCGSYSGGTLRFTATLLPGGAMQFASRDDASEVIPICVVSHPLKHALPLSKSCAIDVELEAVSILVPSHADASR